MEDKEAKKNGLLVGYSGDLMVNKLTVADVEWFPIICLLFGFIAITMALYTNSWFMGMSAQGCH